MTQARFSKKPRQGTYATSVFYGSLAAGRLAALFVAGHVVPHVMLITSVVLCAVGGAALLFLGQYSLIALEVRQSSYHQHSIRT